MAHDDSSGDEARHRSPTEAAARRRQRRNRTIGLAGILFTGLQVASVLLLRQHPPANATDAEVAAWFADGTHRAGLITGLYLAPLASIFFLWFVAEIRTRIGDREDRLLGTVFLTTGVLFAACMLAASAAWGGLAAAAEFFEGGTVLNASTVAYGRGTGYSLAMVGALRMAGVFTMVTSTVGLRTGALPRPLVLAGYLIAVVLLFWVSYLDVLVVLFPVWVCLVSIEFLRRGVVRGERR